MLGPLFFLFIKIIVFVLKINVSIVLMSFYSQTIFNFYAKTFDFIAPTLLKSLPIHIRKINKPKGIP